jgi:transposase
MASKHASDRDRHYIQRLKEQGWKQKDIAAEMGWSAARVSYLLKQPITPKKRSGRPPKFNTTERQSIVQFIESSSEARDLPWGQVSIQFGAGQRGHAMSAALKKEGYQRRVARKKPLLTAAMRASRLKWAQEMIQFTKEDWRNVLWTDESYIAIDGPHRRWKTRRISQTYHPQCLQPKFRHSTKVMIWGSISGHGQGPLLLWKKEWGTVTAKSYCKHTVPVVVDYLKQFPELVFMHDLAPGHKAYLTKAALQRAQIVVLTWPANSPDLNPIEAIWQEIKELIYKLSPRPKNIAELKTCIENIWQSLDKNRIIRLIDSMPERLQAVIDAQGGHTKW